MSLLSKQTLLLSGALLICSGVEAISRVGNARIGDSETRFTAPIPTGYRVERENTDRSLDLGALRTVRDPQHPGSQSFLIALYARDFALSFPEHRESSRQDLSRFFQSTEEMRWQKISTANTCVDLYRGYSSSVETLVAVWGPTSGVMFNAESGWQTRWALDEIAEGLIVEEGACQWP